MMDDDPRLLETLRSASQEGGASLEDLLAQHRGRLRKLLQVRMDRRLQGRVDPSDVIQEAFLEATTRLNDYLQRPAMPFFVWLRFLAVQKLALAHRHHLGTQARDAGREVSLSRNTSPEASSAILADQLLGRLSSPSQAALREERKQRLEQALFSMEPIDCEILVLRHFEELTNQETASVLEISPTAANNRYIRALKRLKEILVRLADGQEWEW